MMLLMKHMGDISEQWAPFASGDGGSVAEGARAAMSGSSEAGVLSDDVFQRELDAFVARSAQATTWRVERLLKQSDFETTELVEGEPRGSVPGRYIRKRIDMVVGAGAVYHALWDAQRTGKCPACVPRLIELGVQGDELTVVMEYVAGSTIMELVASLGAGQETAALIMPGLCDAVELLHRAFEPPLIHRDLKPSNVIMREGKPVIIDFGAARQWRDGASCDTTHFLTRCYAPPEQFGFGQTDERTDVYALGKVLYFCLVGENPPNVCDARACEAAGISRGLGEVICRACAFDPDGRYESARALGDAVEGALLCAEICGQAVFRGGEGSFAVGPERVRNADAQHLAVHAEMGRADARSDSPAIPSSRTERASRSIASKGWAMLESLSTKHQRLLRMPLAVWNALLATGCALLAIGSVMAIVSPNAHDAQLPLWFRVLEYVGVGMVSPGALAYLLSDKRFLRAHIPGLAGIDRRKETMCAAAAFLVGILVPMVFGMVAGLI